jgi:hypothetical protein
MLNVRSVRNRILLEAVNMPYSKEIKFVLIDVMLLPFLRIKLDRLFPFKSPAVCYTLNSTNCNDPQLKVFLPINSANFF